MSEYCYSTGQNKNNIYIFEMKITYNDDSIIKKRLISDLNCGELIQVKNYIKKIKISLCLLNSNKILENIVIKKNINNTIDYLQYLNNNLLLILKNDNNIVSINYNIIR